MITEEERKLFLKNEEKLWDLAALTAAPTIYGMIFKNHQNQTALTRAVSREAYILADALMAERRKRLKEPRKF